jgi:predicted peroxiredoxin
LSVGSAGGTLAESRDSTARATRSEDRMKFIYVVTTGTDDPTKASLPLHLAANGSVEVGHDTSVLLAGDATEILFGDNLDQMQGIGVPPVRELIAKLRDHAVPVYV